jgi:hypothetical protein
MLQVGFGKAAVPSATEIADTRALRNGPFDPCALRVALMKCLGILVSSCCRNGLMLGIRTQGQLSTGRRRTGTGCARRTRGTRAAMKRHMNHRFSLRSAGGLPNLAGLSLRAANGVGCPVNAKTGGVKPFLCFCLPTVIALDRANEINPIGLSAAQQEIRIDIP